jgi:hypothetical protein
MTPATDPIRYRSYLSLEGAAVRGGFLLAEYPGSFGDGASTVVLNCREPLSEGIVDKKYMMVAVRQLKWIQKQNSYLFALGMGSEQARFSRLLRGAGWTLVPVPFMFRVIRPGRFLTEIKQLQTSPTRRLLARAVAISGTGAIGISALQFRSVGAVWSCSGFVLEPVQTWGDWADELWQGYVRRCSFAVTRDRVTLASLYRLGENNTRAFIVRRGAEIVGWVTTLDRKMSNHKYFGGLHVGTVLDAVALPIAMQPTIVLATRALKLSGVELVVTNQSHRDWVRAFKRSGYLGTHSNYILALSSQLAEHIRGQPGALDAMHFTRGDSDGRIHLQANSD